MGQQKPLPTQLPDNATDAISAFLASPPEGTPAEIIEAFDVTGAQRHLPPKLFLETVEQAPVAISITDPQARILYANAAFERLTGYDREEVIGGNQSRLSSKSTPIAVYQDLWDTIKDHRVWHGTLVNRHKNGEDYLADLTISPVLNAKGRAAFYLGMHRDVTQVHQLQQRLKFQKNLTEAALDAAPMAVALIGSDRKVLLDNLAYKALLGDVRGWEPAEFFLAALEKQIDFSLDQMCLNGEGFHNVEIRLDPPSGSEPRWFECSGVRVSELDEAAKAFFKHDMAGRCYLLLFVNEVTTRRRRTNEARLNMIRAGMAEQQLVQTMREAISGAIYKMQAPLNVIKAASVMQDSEGSAANLGPVLQQALDSGNEAMDSLYAALPSPTEEKTSQINVNEVVHEVLRLSTPKMLANGVVVDWRPTAVLPHISGRTNALRGLFKYLLDNAICAVNDAERDYREIRVQTHEQAGDLVIELMDNGPGVPEPLRLKVFEPFFSDWEQSFDHAGMGLTMAQEAAISHGGSIEFDPHFLGGCRVIVRLPIDNHGGS